MSWHYQVIKTPLVDPEPEYGETHSYTIHELYLMTDDKKGWTQEPQYPYSHSLSGLRNELLNMLADLDKYYPIDDETGETIIET